MAGYWRGGALYGRGCLPSCRALAPTLMTLNANSHSHPTTTAAARAFRSRFLELHVEDIPDDELTTILEKR